MTCNSELEIEKFKAASAHALALTRATAQFEHAAITGLSLQKLGHEAWNRLLESRGLEPLEPVTANVPSGRIRR